MSWGQQAWCVAVISDLALMLEVCKSLKWTDAEHLVMAQNIPCSFVSFFHNKDISCYFGLYIYIYMCVYIYLTESFELIQSTELNESFGWITRVD